MTQAEALRNCPTCDTVTATAQATYSPAPWTLGTCDGCGLTYLRNPPAYEALEEDFAWEKTYVEKKTSSKGSTPLSPLARKIRNGLHMYRDKTDSFRKWFNDGHVLDVGSGIGTRIAAPMTPYGIELSKALHAQSDTGL